MSSSSMVCSVSSRQIRSASDFFSHGPSPIQISRLGDGRLWRQACSPFVFPPRYGAQAQDDPSSEVSVAAEQGAPNPARFGDDSGALASTSPGETSYVYCRSEMAHAGRFTVPAKKRSVAEAAGKRVTIARPDRAQALPQHDRDSASGGVGRIMVWMEGAPHQCPGAVALGGRQVVAERSTESR